MSQAHLRLCLCACTWQLCIPYTHGVVALPLLLFSSLTSEAFHRTWWQQPPPPRPWPSSSSKACGHGRPGGHAPGGGAPWGSAPAVAVLQCTRGDVPWRRHALRQCRRAGHVRPPRAAPPVGGAATALRALDLLLPLHSAPHPVQISRLNRVGSPAAARARAAPWRCCGACSRSSMATREGADQEERRLSTASSRAAIGGDGGCGAVC
jgi:hypothetical protein